MYSFVSWSPIEEDRDKIRQYLLKYICTYPLRAACSIVVEHPGSKFIEEYIIPQLLLQWVLNDEDFDGIRYESCNSSDEVNTLGGHNIVLVTKQYDSDGYDTTLRELVKVAMPSEFDINAISISPSLQNCLNGRDKKEVPFFWGLENISFDFEKI